MNKVVILSGGLDSTILTYMVHKTLIGTDSQLYALSFNYMQKQVMELHYASRTCYKLNIPHTIIPFQFMADILRGVSANISNSSIEMPTINNVLGDPQPVTYVPYRNMMMLSVAFSFAEAVNANEVFMGIQTHDEYGYWDTTEYFVDRINDVSSLNRQHSIKLSTPFARSSKADEIRIGLSLDVPFEDTLTCYNPVSGNISCGKCPSCAERIMNFAKVGIVDPIPYAVSIDWDTLFESYKE